MKFSKSKELVYENPAIKTRYKHGETVYGLTFAEFRICTLYDRLQKGIKPWEWDWQNYSGENEDMMGRFYPEDIANITQIEEFEGYRQRRSLR